MLTKRSIRVITSLIAIFGLASLTAFGTVTNQLSVRNPVAVSEIAAGKRAVANAAWWGFDRDDSTDIR